MLGWGVGRRPSPRVPLFARSVVAVGTALRGRLVRVELVVGCDLFRCAARVLDVAGATRRAEVSTGIRVASRRIMVRRERTIWDDIDRMPSYAQFPAALVVGVALLVRLVVVGIGHGVAWLWRRGRWGRVVVVVFALAAVVVAVVLVVGQAETSPDELFSGGDRGQVLGGDIGNRSTEAGGLGVCSASFVCWYRNSHHVRRVFRGTLALRGSAVREGFDELLEGDPVTTAPGAQPVTPDLVGIARRAQVLQRALVARSGRHYVTVWRVAPWTEQAGQGEPPRARAYEI